MWRARAYVYLAGGHVWFVKHVYGRERQMCTGNRRAQKLTTNHFRVGVERGNAFRAAGFPGDVLTVSFRTKIP